jgi:hypothetical protein
MAVTYDPIATTTLGSAASSITFSSIPSTYTDLQVVLTVLPTAANRPYLQFNSDTGTNYSRTIIYGDGTSATSTATANTNQIITSALTSDQVNLTTWDIFSYAGSTYKTVLGKVAMDKNGSGVVVATVGLWRSTSAINTINITASASTFAAGTTCTVYGIKAA